MKALADLPEVAPTRDESRAIRLSVLQEVAPRLRGSRPWGRRLYAAAGALALVAAGVVGVSVLNPGGSGPQKAAAPLRDQAAPSQVLEFSSSDEVVPVVAARPEVIQGVRRYRVADVARKLPEALEEAQLSGRADAASQARSRAQQGEDASDPPALFEAPSGESVQGRSAGDCLRETLRSQSYPLIPLLSRAAIFEGEPVWLLVYSWTTSKAPNAPLDRVQVWLVSQQDCQERYYSSF